MSLTIKASRTRKRTAALGVSITTKQDRHINVETKFIFTLLSQLMLASLCLACVKYTKFN